MPEFSPGFMSVRDFTLDITTKHPGSEFRETLWPHRFVEIDKRPSRDLRIQFSFGSEGGEIASHLTVVEEKPVVVAKRTLGRISVTGEMDIRPVRGWHVFDLVPDGTIDNFESPPLADKDTSRNLLSDAEIDELKTWLEANRDTIWCIS